MIGLQNDTSNHSSLLTSSRYLFQPIQAESNIHYSSMHTTVISNINQTHENDVLLNLPIIDLQEAECKSFNVDHDEIFDFENDDDSEIEEELQHIYSKQHDGEMIDDDDWADHIVDVEEDHLLTKNIMLSESPINDIFMSSLCSFGMSYRQTNHVDDFDMADDENWFYHYNYNVDPIDDEFDIVDDDAIVGTTITTSCSETISPSSPTCVGNEAQETYDEINQKRHQLWKQSLKSSLFHKTPSSSSSYELSKIF
jgi:hypothetical protein